MTDNRDELRHLVRNDGEKQLVGRMEAVALFRGYERTAGFSVGEEDWRDRHFSETGTRPTPHPRDG